MSPMDRESYLLIQLAEELNELAKELLKCVRFTPHHIMNGTHDSNLTRANREYADVLGLIEMLSTEGIRLVAETSLIEAKKAKVEHFMRVSQTLRADYALDNRR